PSQSFPSHFGGLTGAIGPVITTLIAFLMGGLVVLATGKNPFKVYHAIFNGTGLNWFFHVGSHTARIPFTTHKVWFPWATASVAGILKATVGAHEVISTIMLNWISIWVGLYLFGQGGPLQNKAQPFIPLSSDIAEGAKLPVFWGSTLLQGLSAGIFIAVAML